MQSNNIKAILGLSAVAVSVLLTAGGNALAADSAVNLTAAPTTTTLPDGQTVPMWGYTCGAVTSDGVASCSPANNSVNGGWKPPVIRVPTGMLTINLTNNLTFNNGNRVPTSLLIVGQLGGGLGVDRTTTPAVVHPPQGTTWPGTPGDTSDPGATFTPPAQSERVQSFATEVPVGAPTTLCWGLACPGTGPKTDLRPGTYLIESGTHPSIQGPMGLYGVLIVTDGTYPGVAVDADVALLLSEIDANQNQAVTDAVNAAGFSEAATRSLRAADSLSSIFVTDGGSGYSAAPSVSIDAPPCAVNGTTCIQATGLASIDGDGHVAEIALTAAGAGYTLTPGVHVAAPPAGPGNTTATAAAGQVTAGSSSCVDASRTVVAACYPPAVNYSPRYYLINGISFDRSHPDASAQTIGETAANGGVLLRFVNAGLRAHVPSVVGASMSLRAEDGNVLPGAARVQDEVLLPAGKTYDVTISPAKDATTGSYAAATYAVFDRQLSLSTNNQRDGGMIAHLNVAGGAGPAQTAAVANQDDYFVVAGSTLTVSDVARGVIANDVGVYGVQVVGTVPGLDLRANGTFTYSSVPAPPSSFSYCANGTVSGGVCSSGITGTVHLNLCASGCLGAPTAVADNYTSDIASRVQISPPGVLANDTDTLGLPLTASLGTVSGGTVTLHTDGSFTASPSCAPNCPVNGAITPVTFQYTASNPQGASASTTATVSFGAPSGLQVTLTDGKSGAVLPNDYRWIIEEDRTVHIDPTAETNDPTTPVRNLGVNFHTSHTPIVAAGCVGTLACETGQTLLGEPAVCDIGNGACRTDSSHKIAVRPSQVHLDATKRYYLSILPGTGANDPEDSSQATPHSMGGAQIAPGQTSVNVSVQALPLPSAKISVFVFEDDNPLNGENDTGGGVDVLAPNEAGLEGFHIVLLDQTGQFGDPAGQLTYDEFGEPVSNSLAGTIDPTTGRDACPISPTSTDGLVGMIVTCPKYEGSLPSDTPTTPRVLSPLAGHAIIANMYPGMYEVHTTPGADRTARGEEWLQTNTLDGTKDIEAFIKAEEPAYFQEFGPGGYHVAVGFANPAVINARKAGVCAGQACNATINGIVTGMRMSRTPDQRVYSSGDYEAYSFGQCYVSLGAPDGADFAFTKCNPDGTFQFTGIPLGNMKVTVFDQWNDLLVDGLSTPVKVDSQTIGTPDRPLEIAVTQWRTNLYGRIYLDQNGNGLPDKDADGNDLEPGLPLVPYNIRYRDGSYMGFNNTDLAGGAGFNEVFPFLNWMVVDTDSARYKQTGVHVVYDAGGPVDGTPGGADSAIGASFANTTETNGVRADLRVPGAVYCSDADCSTENQLTNPGGGGPGGSTGRIDPGWVPSEGWQGLLGQNSFVEFAMRPFKDDENGGIRGHVIYTSTRPFDDPALLLQLSWEPGVANVKINLYQEGVAQDGTKSLKLVDTTTTTSWDNWAQGFRRNADGTLALGTDGKPIANMSCPGQDPASPFYFTLLNSTQALNPTPMAADSQFKCYDGWSMLNQVQPAPYNGMYKFPSVVAKSGPTAALPTDDNWSLQLDPKSYKTNCTICSDTLDGPMLPPGKYVVEVVVPPGYELVKEEDKNILLGDIYIAPAVQQFPGFGNIFILPDQAAVNALYNPYNPLQATNNNGATPRREGDTGSVEVFWPCVGEMRIVPDLNSLFPGAGQQAPFAGATRPLCDRKEVTLENQMTALAKFYVFTSTHIAGHFTGTITNDFASEFDPFSPQFGEKFAVPNAPVAFKDYTGKEVGRVYADQWGNYNGMNYSTWTVNPPSPSGYIPQMMLACMNDPGPIPDPAHPGQMIEDPAYNPAYADYCYEIPLMPGETAYLDTPVIPTMAFAAGYNLPDCEYPDTTPAIKSVEGSLIPASTNGRGPWLAMSGSVASVTVGTRGNYTAPPAVAFNNTGTGGSGAASTALMGVNNVSVNASNRYPTGTPTVTFANPSCAPVLATGPCVRATGTVQMTGNGASRRIGAINVSVANMGSGYTTLPGITVNCTGTCTNTVPATPTTTSLRVNTVAVTAGGSGYTSSPAVNFASGTATATAELGAFVASDQLTITALGDKDVLNHGYSGPNATSTPYNAKKITRHYGFGGRPSTCPSVGACPDVTIAGVPMTDVTTWSNDQIIGSAPSLTAGQSTCTMQQRGVSTQTRCGELEITAANGKKSIDTVTVTLGGKPPTYVTPTTEVNPAFGRGAPSPIQTAIDNAVPGDLIILGPGTYRENVLMWKPVRLQGVGAESVMINGDAHPAGNMDPWRRQVDCLFGLALNGRPLINDGTFTAEEYDPTHTYDCPRSMQQRVDRIPFETVVGWDATGNGNLAQMLQEPTLMGAYEGAGITVLGRGIHIPNNSNDFWGASSAGDFPDGYVYLTNGNGNQNCGSASTNRVDGRDYGTSNFLCNPSRIDGISVINSSQGGGAIFAHAWNHNLEISNTRVHGNHGTLTGGITIGNGEFPDPYIVGGDNPPPDNLPVGGLVNGQQAGYGFNRNIIVHNNYVTSNLSLGDALYSGTPSAAGGVTFCTGSDGYRFNGNWICGNMSSGDAGGVAHTGFINDGVIQKNWILFNQSANPTIPTNGGGLGVLGASPDRTLPNGDECGSLSDADCPPALPEGTGRNLLIDANLIMGNSAESGSGGGLRLQLVNGDDVVAFPNNPNRWNNVTVTNNIIANNVAGWDGGGVSLQDALEVKFINNTVVSNDTTASAGVLFNTLGAPLAASPPPGCNPGDNPNATCPPTSYTTHSTSQAAGLVTMPNTPNLSGALNPGVNCPSGYGYSNNNSSPNNCRFVSRPLIANDLFWQNRPFHIEVGDPGSGQQGQQNLVFLEPLLNQVVTGMCATSGVRNSSAVSYWDVGARGDTGPSDHSSGVNLLPPASIALTSSILSSGGDPAVLRQYCNGARMPPEHCASVTDPLEQARCKGFEAPAGHSETTGLYPQFALNQITPAATVDEGNNWINLSYGPLSLVHPVDGETALGNYSIGTGSSAINAGVNATGGANGAPSTASDFFGISRPQGSAFDIGAVEFKLAAGAAANVSPGALDFGTFVTPIPPGTTATKTLTLRNNGTATLNGISITVSGAGFAQSAGGTCGATLAAGTCTINVTFTPSAVVGTVSGAVAVSTTETGAVVGSPVALTATVATPPSVTVNGGPLTFVDVPVDSTATKTLTLHNTGGSTLNGLTVTVTGAGFSRPADAAGGSCASGAPVGNCTIIIAFTPTSTAPASGSVAISGSNGTVTGSPVSLSGTSVVRSDFSVTKSDGVTTVFPGGRVNYSIVVTNNGPSRFAGATVADTRPAALSSWSWSCTPASRCGAGGNTSQTGNIAKTLGTLQSGQTVTFTVTGTVATGASGNLVNTATVGGVSAVDTNSANNSAVDTDTIATGTGLVTFQSATGGGGTLSGTTLNFGSQNGLVHISTITIGVGGASVTFGSSYVTNTAGIGFALVTDSCSGRTVAAGGTCTIRVNFNALGTTLKTGTLSIPDSGTGSPQVLSLSGT